jgi:hypothetical protein
MMIAKLLHRPDKYAGTLIGLALALLLCGVQYEVGLVLGEAPDLITVECCIRLAMIKAQDPLRGSQRGRTSRSLGDRH